MGELIKAEDAMIVWSLDRSQPLLLDEIHVYKYTKEDHEAGYGPDLYDYWFSMGNCDKDWPPKKKEDLACEVLRIAFTYNIKNKKKFLMELGKIKELDCIRKMVYWMFCEFKDEMSYEEFKDKYYY
jgi:hypothetical protein